MEKREVFKSEEEARYIMNKHTPVWVANHGNSGNTGVIDIVDNDYEIIIITGYCEF